MVRYYLTISPTINAMVDYGWKLKDYKIVVRNHPVEKRDMYTFNYQHCLIFTRTGTIKRAGDFLKGIMVYDTTENERV